MKKAGILFMAAAAFTVVSCSSTDEAKDGEEGDVKVEAVTYTLDNANSSIQWTGRMSADYYHSGTVNFTEGSVTMEGEELTSGSFVVDMTTIKDTSLDAPKSDYLTGHLQGTVVDEDHPKEMFFNTEMFPKVDVKVNSYKDGKLNLTLNILGKSLEQTVDASVTSNEGGASIKGSFNLDLTSLGIMGLQVNPADGSQISPMIEFVVVAALTK